MNAVRCLIRGQQMSRGINTSALRWKDLAKLKEKQRLMQLDDTVPVYLKKGASDRIIFVFIALGVSISMMMSAHTIKRLIYPAPPS